MILIHDKHVDQLAQWLAELASAADVPNAQRYMAAQFSEIIDHAKRGYPRLVVNNGTR